MNKHKKSAGFIVYYQIEGSGKPRSNNRTKARACTIWYNSFVIKELNKYVSSASIYCPLFRYSKIYQIFYLE